MENTDRAKTVQKPCTHGLQNKKAMKSFDPQLPRSTFLRVGTRGLSKAALWLCLRRYAPPPCSSPFYYADKKKTRTRMCSGFLGAMEGTRTPGLLIRRNRIAHFVHFIIQRQIVVLIESQLFFRCYSVASFALLARLCTCYPSLRCAENVQKCAEPKSARQNRLFRTAPKAGFQRYLLCKIFQFYPNNNLT